MLFRSTESDGKYRVYLDNYYENNNLGATINYQIQRGDVVRFLWQTPKGIYYGMDMTDSANGDIFYYTDYIELEVLDYDPGEAGGRQSIYVSRMNKNLISKNNKFYSILVEIYRPQPAIIDNDVFVSPWRDITRSFNILNPHTTTRVHDVESVALTFVIYKFLSGTRDYIDVVGNIPLESGTTIKINNWTGSSEGNDVYAIVSSYVYPSSVNKIRTTKYFLENVYYENTGDTFDYLTAPYSSNQFQVTYYTGSASIYGIPQEYGGNPAQVYPRYGDVFMRQRIYGTGVSINSLQLEEGARDRKSTRLNSSHSQQSRMPSSA